MGNAYPPTPGDAYWSVVFHANFGEPHPDLPADLVPIPLTEALEILDTSPGVADATRFRAAQLLAADAVQYRRRVDVPDDTLRRLVTPRTGDFGERGPLAIGYTGRTLEVANGAEALLLLLKARTSLAMLAPGPSIPPTCDACVIGGVTRFTMRTQITVAGPDSRAKVLRIADPRSWASCSDPNDGWIYSIRYSPDGTGAQVPNGDLVTTPLGSAWSGQFREVVKIHGIATPYRIDLFMSFVPLPDGVRVDFQIQPGAVGTGPAIIVKDDGYLQITESQPDTYDIEMYKELDFQNVAGDPGTWERFLPFSGCSWFTYVATQWTECFQLPEATVVDSVTAKFDAFMNSTFSDP